MARQSNFALLPIAAIVLFGTSAKADEVKQLTVEKGKATIIANLIAPRPDCSNNPGPQPLPLLSQKPLHGAIGLQIGTTDVSATGSCPARKIPSIALFYAPPSDFLGSDSFQIEVDAGNNKKTIVSYQITVQAPENKR